MATRKIKLPLNNALKRYLSSGDYEELTNDFFSHLDLLYTYFFRYPRLFAVDIGGSQISQGFAVDATASHPLAACTTTLLFVAIAVSGVSSEYLARQKASKAKEEQADYNNSYHHIQNTLTNNSKTLSSAEIKEIDEVRCKVNAEKLNEKINAILLQDNNLKNKYRTLEITKEGNIEFTLVDDTKKETSFFSRLGKKVSAIISSSWITMGLCSFAYWILWMGCGIFTGNFGIGISAIGSWAFIMPLAVAAVYPATRIRNWWLNHYGNKIKTDNETVIYSENSEKSSLAALDLAKIMRKSAFMIERERLEAELKEVNISVPNKEKVKGILENDSKVAILTKNSRKRIAAEFIAVTISSFTGAQYAAWIITDLLKVAANVTLNGVGFSMGFGIAFMACSVIYGAYKAYIKHKEIVRYREQSDEIKAALDAKVNVLENIYKDKLSLVQNLAGEITKLDQVGSWLSTQMNKFNNTMALAPKIPEQPKAGLRSYLYAFVNGITTGVLIARIATIAGTAVFLPFAAAALGNPYTIGLIVTLGVVYGLFQVYQHWQKQEENSIKAIHTQREENINSLQDQIDLANLQIKLLEDKKEKLQQNAISPLSEIKTRAAGIRLFADDTILASKTSTRVSKKQKYYSYDDGFFTKRPVLQREPVLLRNRPSCKIINFSNLINTYN